MAMFFWLPANANWNFKPVLDVRERFERRLDKDFSESNNDNRSDLLSRIRAGVDFKYQKNVSGRVLYQYGHDLTWSAAENFSSERSDLFVAYADIKTDSGKFRLGRQQLSKGNDRLLGLSEWGNTGRSYDMVRWTAGRWDAWGGRLAVNSKPNKKAYIGGASYESKWGETMLLYKHDDTGSSQDDIYTLDHIWKNKAGKWTTNFELAGQAGRTGDNKLEAWATSLRVDYKLNKKWNLYAEGNAASGGKRGDTVLTFDQIYASNHARYGILDAQGWRNMKGLCLGANYRATDDLSFTVEFNRFGLWAADDAWYSDGGKANKGDGFTFKDATGSKGTDVGDEFDFSGSYKLDKQNALDAGICVFHPGNFIDAFAGAGSRSQVYGYLQYRFKF